METYYKVVGVALIVAGVLALIWLKRDRAKRKDEEKYDRLKMR